METLRRFINVTLVVVLVVAGTVITTYLVRNRPQPALRTAPVMVPAVATTVVEPRPFAAPIVGHGTVRAKREVAVVPEVSGKVISTHAGLAEGAVIPEGDLLFEIDSRVYRSRVAQAKAETRRLNATRQRLELNTIHLTARLGEARALLDLASAQLERERGLRAQEGSTVVEVDAALEKYHRQKEAVINLENQLAAVPVQLEETSALIEAQQASLEQAELNVERTRIHCPFNARVESVSARTSQVVMAHLSIARLTDVESFEIPVMIDPRELRWTDTRVFARAMGRDIGPPPQATVTWTLYGQQFRWSGSITRLERLDERTRTARMVIEVENVTANLALSTNDLGQRLAIGMFCRAELPAEVLRGALIVPRRAIVDQQSVYVYVPEGDAPQSAYGRLASRRVNVLRVVGDDALVRFDPETTDRVWDSGRFAVATRLIEECELQPGEQVIVSPLARPVEGMRLRRIDDRLSAELALNPAATDRWSRPPGTRLRRLVSMTQVSLTPFDGSRQPMAPAYR